MMTISMSLNELLFSVKKGGLNIITPITERAHVLIVHSRGTELLEEQA
jgi:hypothetical protein